MSVEELAEVCRQLDKHLTKGWIKLSVALYRALILFVCKKEGTLHMCINFRMLNEQAKTDAYPIPQINKILDCLCKARVFSKIDLNKLYHQVAIEPLHTYKTAFLTKYGLFRSLVLLFGLVNAPETF